VLVCASGNLVRIRDTHGDTQVRTYYYKGKRCGLGLHLFLIRVRGRELLGLGGDEFVTLSVDVDDLY
jgi:hypothetical protein